ncbi:3'-5' exonuclease [Telluribacter humicola]|uniref:3'-5' exonuclease n=1 Tax=Telluribacter humicola TaxID=1720261 RepID=UPI001A97BE2F|nr:exonuclease domain-containing protein [Telluribacter humicola]
MSKAVKVLFYDLETTGLHPSKHGIHQLSGRLYINWKLVKEFNCHVRPFEGDEIDDYSLKIAGKTRADLANEHHVHPHLVYRALLKTLNTYCDRFDKQDKYFLAGYNNASFDNPFLRNFFEKNDDKYFGSYFWSSPIDCFILASQALMARRHLMADFKLSTVAQEMGIPVDESKLHDALYDLDLTIALYSQITGVKLSNELVGQRS